MKTKLFFIVLLGLALFTASCSDDDAATVIPKGSNIVELAQDTPDLSLLVDALIQADAGLVDLLQTDGPFTVFAPTNQAFADLLDALGTDYTSLADFDTPAEKTLLANILSYHVVAAQALSTDLSDGQVIDTPETDNNAAIIAGAVIASIFLIVAIVLSIYFINKLFPLNKK